MGGFGCVYRGKWHGDVIAVKIFLSSEEASWGREVEIYKTPGLNHENILRYIAADSTDISNRIELWLATEYHENGSVYDYLMNHTITPRILTKMVYSIANGLWNLHIPIAATNGKVAFAHRDLKTRNILVKKDLLLANSSNQEQVVIDIQANSRVGTQRYMAPEVLDGTLNERSFESFKAADIYALGLVYWEILRRCRTNPNENDADEYQVPYEDILPNNPTFDQMRDVVCTKKIRPPSSPRWQSESLENDLSSINIELQQQSTQNDGPWTA